MMKDINPAKACLAIFIAGAVFAFAYNAGEAVGKATYYNGVLL